MGESPPYRYDHPRPAVTVDIVCLRRAGPATQVALIRRGHAPFAGTWALPGGFVEMDEDLPQAARRELAEEAGLRPGQLLEVGSFGRPGRDPRGRTISVAFLALVETNALGQAGDDAAGLAWYDWDRLPELAFDHREIIHRARRRLTELIRLGECPAEWRSVGAGLDHEDGMSIYDGRYDGLEEAEIRARLRAAKERLSRSLVILAHHYQPDSVVEVADVIGDSLKLSSEAAGRRDARYIVFCGVYFMAEVARMLAGPEQRVILPDPSAGCGLADMATADQLEACWAELARRAPGRTVVPLTYINSSARMKAFCGRHGGAVCTSGNGPQVLEWALGRADLVLFGPDQHLGRNAAFSMGYSLDRMVVYDPGRPAGGLPERLGRDVALVLWAGSCHVHMRFTPQDVDRVRREYPAIRVIVHPECTFEVVQAADEAGSTEYIIKRIAEAPAGSLWAVGTERDMVNRLARRYAGEKTVVNLSSADPFCDTMKRCSPSRLLWVLEGLAEGRVVNEVFVDEAVTREARAALDRMLEIRATVPGPVKAPPTRPGRPI